MNRKFLVPFTIFVILAISVSAGAQPPSFVKLTLLSTNDLHAYLSPFDHPESLAGRIPEVKNVGGAARRATYVNRVRAASCWPVLLLDSGDTTYRTSALGKAFRGAPDIEVLNAMGNLAMAPGNHDFQWPSMDTLRNIKSSRFPWVCANLIDKKTGKSLLSPYVIQEHGGVRIAFLGLITSLVNSAPYVATHELGLHTVDPIETANKLMPEIRQKADIVICLSHLGRALDEQLAKEAPGIDIILGGHSHTRLPQPVLVPVDAASATSIGAVPVVQAFCWGSEIGHTDVIFHRNPQTGAYSLMSCKGKLVPINSNLPDDPTIAGLLQKWEAKRLALPVPAPATAR